MYAGSGPVAMLEPYVDYALSVLVFMLPWPILWMYRKLKTLTMIILLFAMDVTLTVEAALYSDIVLIAILHVITIPALIALIYLDLVQEHKSYFRCFICGKLIEDEEEIETISRTIEGKPKNVLVHTKCIQLEGKDKKKISSWVFRHGIPE
jgi:hypothetical protein